MAPTPRSAPLVKEVPCKACIGSVIFHTTKAIRRGGPVSIFSMEPCMVTAAGGQRCEHCVKQKKANCLAPMGVLQYEMEEYMRIYRVAKRFCTMSTTDPDGPVGNVQYHFDQPERSRVAMAAYQLLYDLDTATKVYYAKHGMNGTKVFSTEKIVAHENFMQNRRQYYAHVVPPLAPRGANEALGDFARRRNAWFCQTWPGLDVHDGHYAVVVASKKRLAEALRDGTEPRNGDA